MKKRTSNVSRRIVSLLMSMVLMLTLVTPAAFATEVVDGSGTTIVEGNANPADVNTSGDAEGKNDVENTGDGEDEQQPADPGDENKNPDEGDGEDAASEPSSEADTQEGEGTDTPVVAQRTVTVEQYRANGAYEVKIVVGVEEDGTTEKLDTTYAISADTKTVTLKLTTADYAGEPVYIKTALDDVLVTEGENQTPALTKDTPTLEYTLPDEGDVTLYYGTQADFVSAWYTSVTTGSKYTIRSAEELAYLATLVNDGTQTFSGNKTITLARDIDLKDVSWTPIGTGTNPFKGTFSGVRAVGSIYNYHKISGLNGDLFGVVDGGTIQYVTINGGTGRLVNELKSGKVENCMSTAKVDSSDENPAVGGLVGTTGTGATVSRSYYYNTESINTPAVDGDGTVTNCFYLAETSTFDKKGTTDDTGARTAEEFAAGRVTWGLNGSDTTISAANNYWGQDNDQPYLVLNKPVYELTLTKNAGPGGVFVEISAEGYTTLTNSDTQYLYVAGGTQLTVVEPELPEGYVIDYSPRKPTEVATWIVSTALTYTYTISKEILDISWYVGHESEQTYTLETAAQMLGFAALVNGTAKSADGKAIKRVDFKGKTVKLANDIDISAYEWIPIGGSSKFAGTFDGTGHSVTVTINAIGRDVVGLFGYVSGTIKNLTVSGTVTANGNGEPFGRVAGIVGDLGGTVSMCVNAATVTAYGYGCLNMGGIAAGNIYYSTAKITNCLNNGTITGTVAESNTENVVTGIGYISVFEGEIAISQCWNTGDITIKGTNINSRVAGITVYSGVESCANFGTVSNDAGGYAVGVALDMETECAPVINSYNTGKVSAPNGTTYAIGDGSVTNSYYIRNMNGTLTGEYINGKTHKTITVAEDAEHKTVYTVGTAADALVDVLNQNKGANLGWLNKLDAPFNPVHIYKWNGEPEPGAPGTATVIYHPNGATIGTDKPNIVMLSSGAEQITFTLQSADNLEYKHENGTFLGWNTDSSASKPRYNAGDEISVRKGEIIDLYAVWENIWTGSGSESNPYEIDSDVKLTALQTQVNDKGFSYAGKWFKLTQDINLTSSWTPIGTDPENCFEGSLNGNDKKISGLNITGSCNAAGLFGYVKSSQSSQFKDLTITGNVEARQYAGGLAGCIRGMVALENLTTSVAVSVSFDHSGGAAGGLCGTYDATALTVKNCKNEGSISGAAAGGFVGDSSGTAVVRFYNCVNTGAVTGRDTAAGFVAIYRLAANLTSSFEGCDNGGAVTATAGRAAGIAITSTGNTVTNCTNRGTISGDIAAGILGTGGAVRCTNTGTINGTACAAGIVANFNGVGKNIVTSFCANFGKVTATAGSGAAKPAYGIASQGTIKNCFTYNNETHVPVAGDTTGRNCVVTNSYYLANSKDEFPSTMGGEWASADDFASGKVAWGVGGKGEGSQGGTGQDAQLGWWKQDKDDKYPTLLPTPDMSKRYYRTDVDCGTGGEVELTRNASNTVKELSSKEAVYGPAGTSVTIKATPKDNTFGLKSLTLDLMGTGSTTALESGDSFTLGEANALVVAAFASTGNGGSGGGTGGNGGDGDGTGTDTGDGAGDENDEGLQDGLNMDVEYNIKGLVLAAYAEWGANGGGKTFAQWLKASPSVLRAFITNSLDNMAAAAKSKDTDEAKGLAALLLASLNEHSGLNSKNGDIIGKALQRYMDTGSEATFSTWLTTGSGMASGTVEEILAQYTDSLLNLTERLYANWESSGTSLTFPQWLDAQQVTMESLSENAEEPEAEPDDTQTSEAPEDVPDGQEAEGGASSGGNSVWEVIGTVVRENPIIVWSIVAVVAALIIVGAVRRYHKVKRDERDDVASKK